MLLKSFFSSLFSINCDKVIHLNQENCIFYRILIRLIRFFANIYLSLRCLLIIIYGKEKIYFQITYLSLVGKCVIKLVVSTPFFWTQSEDSYGKIKGSANLHWS